MGTLQYVLYQFFNVCIIKSGHDACQKSTYLIKKLFDPNFLTGNILVKVPCVTGTPKQLLHIFPIGDRKFIIFYLSIYRKHDQETNKVEKSAKNM